MTITVNCYTSGDKWLNQIEMTQQLYAIDKFDTVIVHMQHEGISLKASGILKVIDQWVIDTGRDPATVKIDTSNQFEKIPYQYNNPVLKLTHFFTKTGAPYFCEARPLRMKLVMDVIVQDGYDCNLAQDIVKYNYQHFYNFLQTTT